MLTNEQTLRWRDMVDRGDRQGLINARCNQNLVLARFYRIRCERFTLQRKINAAQMRFLGRVTS